MNLKSRFHLGAAPKLYAQHNAASPLVYYRVEGPDKIWLITEETAEGDDVRFFGYVASSSPEWQYFTLSDLESAHRAVNLKVTEFAGIKLSQALSPST